MRMGQGVRTGLGHGGITCVLQTQFSSYVFFSHIVFRAGCAKWLCWSFFVYSACRQALTASRRTILCVVSILVTLGVNE